MSVLAVAIPRRVELGTPDKLNIEVYILGSAVSFDGGFTVDWDHPNFNAHVADVVKAVLQASPYSLSFGPSDVVRLVPAGL